MESRPFSQIVGIDLSMTSTGVVVMDARPLDLLPGGLQDRVKLHRVQSKPVKDPAWDDRLHRMGDIIQRVVSKVDPGALVFLEAPAYGATGAGTFDRSGLWWMLFATLSGAGCVIVPVSPAQRMLYATGKGGGKDAGKDAVIAAVVRRYPWAEVTGNDVADALVLAAMARRAAGVPLEESMPVANLKALDKLDLTQVRARLDAKSSVPA